MHPWLIRVQFVIVQILLFCDLGYLSLGHSYAEGFAQSPLESAGLVVGMAYALVANAIFFVAVLICLRKTIRSGAATYTCFPSIALVPVLFAQFIGTTIHSALRSRFTINLVTLGTGATIVVFVGAFLAGCWFCARGTRKFVKECRKWHEVYVLCRESPLPTE